jgi:RNA polymerase-binding transcription factor DksA
MARAAESLTEVRERLLNLRSEYEQRVATIHAHARNPLEADSSEQAAQIGNVEVVQALEAEATAEIAAINAALSRVDAGTYGTCVSCGDTIGAARLAARPASSECVDCAGGHARH